MKVNKVKSLLLVCIVTICMCFMITGCGNDKNTEKESKPDNTNETTENISKADYIGLLGTEFGYDSYIGESAIFTDVKESDDNYAQIQACSEWGVIKDSGEFKPDEEVTLEYALKSVVRALGLDDLADGQAAVSEEDLVSFFTSNIAKIDTSNLDSKLDKNVATQIIQYAVDYRNGIELPQKYEYELADNVKKANGDIFLNYDRTTGTFVNGADYKAGDVVYWEAAEAGAPMAVKIKSVDGNTFTYDAPELEEVYATLNISGTYTGTVMDATSASDGTNVQFGKDIYDEVNNYGVADKSIGDANVQLLSNNVKVEKASDYVRFTASAEGTYKDSSSSAKATGTLVAEIKNINVTIDYDTKHILNPEYVKATVTFDTNVSSTITGEFSKSIPLGEVWISVAGPIQLRLVMVANIGANGEVSIAYTTDNVLTAGYKKGAGLQKSFNSTPTLDFEAEVTVTAEVRVLADVVIGFNIAFVEYHKSIINAEVTTGLVAIAKTDGDLLSEDPMCTDILIYVPLRWGINQEACILTAISSKLKYKATVWDSETSAIKKHMHFEDGVRCAADECTRGEGEEVVQEEVDEQGDPFEELKLFDFEMIDFEFIRLQSTLVMMNEGETGNVNISSLPEGYSTSDLVYEVIDGDVCAVGSGTITAKNAGSTIVNVRTTDGIYCTSFVVTVFEDLSVDFDPI